MDSLDQLHGTEGVLLDGFVEKKFAWGSDPADKFNRPRPYLEPWIGIFHNPPNLPRQFNVNQQAPEDILQMQSWRESMHSCKGLFTLSNYLKEWLRPLVPVSVCNLLHPTETPQNQFSAQKYLLNKEKQLVQIGWWLRKFSSLYSLQLTRLKKTLLNLGDAWIDTLHNAELECITDRTKLASVEIVSYLSNDEYDELLSKNIVFLDLYASSANNVIIECIARATPILVNPLPAVVEYLGHEYPLYFETLEEAAWKAENEPLVLAAHEYLKVLAIREKLTRQHFLEAFVNSEIYRQLPSPSCNAGDTIALREANSVCAECKGPVEAQLLLDDSLVQALRLGWDRALAGDGQERANWRVVEGNEWSWQQNAVCANSNGSEWSAYEYSRCDTQALRALKNFVVEVTIIGSAEAAGLSFGPYKDFLAELSPHMDRHRLQLEVEFSCAEYRRSGRWDLDLKGAWGKLCCFPRFGYPHSSQVLRTFCDHHLLPLRTETAVESSKLGTPKPGFRCSRNFGGQSEQPRWHSRALGRRLSQLSTCSRAGSTNGGGFGHK
jgi:hypothetical protein